MRKVLYIFSRLNDEDVDLMAEADKRTRHTPRDVLIKQGGTIAR